MVSSATLLKGMRIVINGFGLVSHTSFRGANDGITYFGRKKNVKKTNNSDHNHESTTKVTTFLIYNIHFRNKLSMILLSQVRMLKQLSNKEEDISRSGLILID